MPERSIRDREPDEGAAIGRGDAAIPDFLAQQQAVADLSDFALQSNAGATLIADQAVTVDPGGAAPIDVGKRADVSPYIPFHGVVAVQPADPNADPVGDPDSTFVMTTGGFTVMNLDFGTTALPSNAAIQVTGALKFTHTTAGATGDADFFVTLVFYDDAGTPVGDGGVMGNAQAYRINDANVWHHISVFCSVPVGATQVGMVIWGYCDAGFVDTSDLVWFNAIKIQPASQLIGVHAGRLSERAAWWLPWGKMVYVNGTAQSNNNINETALTTFGTTWSAIAFRQYRIRALVNLRNNALVTVHLTFRLKVNGTTIVSHVWLVPSSGANAADFQFQIEGETSFATTASQAVSITVQSDNAAGWQTLGSPGHMVIDDVGPIYGKDGGSQVWPLESFAAG